jgi:hypothetical protein
MKQIRIKTDFSYQGKNTLVKFKRGQRYVVNFYNERVVQIFLEDDNEFYDELEGVCDLPAEYEDIYFEFIEDMED